MMNDRIRVTPYHDCFRDLVISTMHAQAEVAEELARKPLALIPDALINRHFAWLTQTYAEGYNRHLFDGIGRTKPLRVMSLRHRRAIPSSINSILEHRDAVPLPDGADFIQSGPTRISQLVKASFSFAIPQDREEDRDDGEPWDDDPTEIPPYAGPQDDVFLRSPLSVVFDYLTVPDMPGSRAYALLPVRNYVFETFGIFPADVGLSSASNTFAVTELEEALSHIWTSLRPRYWSSGRDPLPAEGKTAVGGVLRQFLGARGVFWMRFKSLALAIDYLSGGRLRCVGAYEFIRSNHLERLPDLGELTNELWGLPLPIRGAETLFRGGLKFSSSGGLVMGIHGGPGTGKTSMALALGAVLAPFGIDTLFISAEETAKDLEARVESLVPDELRRLSFFPGRDEKWLEIERLPSDVESGGCDHVLDRLGDAIDDLSAQLLIAPEEEADELTSAPKPCRAVVVLDGVHDLIVAEGGNGTNLLAPRLRQFVQRCRQLRALVILTAGEDWGGERALDYLVDVAIKLTHDSINTPGRKPDRRITLTKGRHQLCSVGTHGLQIGGTKGVRFSPQINYQLDRKAPWRTRLPEMRVSKKVLRRVLQQDQYHQLANQRGRRRAIGESPFNDIPSGLRLFRGSNIFLNGEGSGGKAALALKMAVSPTYEVSGELSTRAEKILVVSFLYPKLYYENIVRSLLAYRRLEYGILSNELRPSIDVIHLYPGNYAADQLFNRIEWMLDAEELQGEPYTTVLIDGLHNVFLQFPEIERYTLFWPQLYAALRLRPLTIISTHTTFVLQGLASGGEYRLDDQRSEPLRHALVQKTDFRFEIDPYSLSDDGIYERSTSSAMANVFCVRTVSAINQPIPPFELMWSRQHLVLFAPKQRKAGLEDGRQSALRL